MKRALTTLLMVFGLGSLFVATPLSAQDHPSLAVVPFPFVVSGKTLPAGSYRISQLSGNSSVFSLQSYNQGAFVASLGTREDGNPQHPSITFARYGSDWMLVKITPPDSLIAYSIGQNAKAKNTKLRMSAMVAVDLK